MLGIGPAKVADNCVAGQSLRVRPWVQVSPARLTASSQDDRYDLDDADIGPHQTHPRKHRRFNQSACPIDYLLVYLLPFFTPHSKRLDLNSITSNSDLCFLLDLLLILLVRLFLIS
ncbi:unnamed protein product [Hymenolepis diminuta]|uniref:Uncharacterized protein n=1 Tax=Hymenolepis diminuta TaxID=6216 RepID=A0A564YVS0_HYMDI|nr:unnamed protein product [Hymenolepis diminuta]